MMLSLVTSGLRTARAAVSALSPALRTSVGRVLVRTAASVRDSAS